MKPNAAFVVDALAAMGGGERVILRALEMFPGAPVFTMVYKPEVFARTILAEHPVIPSWINHLPRSQTHYRNYLPVMPLAVEQFDLRPYDLVISFNYAVAHGVRIWPGQRHFSYTYTPMRYAWRNFPIPRGKSPSKTLTNWLLGAFRKWDLSAAARVNHFAAVSSDIAGWIQRVYHRDAQVIYPPVDLERFTPQNPRENFYVTVSRLVAHKHIDLIVQAFSRLQLPLIVVGNGPELKHLQEIASPNIQFASDLSDQEVADLLGRASAYICAAEEDFGIAVVEAQAAGCPVIAFGKGGALETVIDGKTGLFFTEQTTESLIDAIGWFERQASSFSEKDLVSNAYRFGKEQFMKEFAGFIGIENGVWSRDRNRNMLY